MTDKMNVEHIDGMTLMEPRESVKTAFIAALEALPDELQTGEVCVLMASILQGYMREPQDRMQVIISLMAAETPKARAAREAAIQAAAALRTLHKPAGGKA